MVIESGVTLLIFSDRCALLLHAILPYTQKRPIAYCKQSILSRQTNYRFSFKTPRVRGIVPSKINRPY